MIKTSDNIKLQFIPSSVQSFDEIKLNKQIMSNDIYSKYHATAEVVGQLIICNDVSKMKKYTKKIKKESYEEYLLALEQRDPKKDEWIYNIINGTAEQDKIIYRDELCIVIPTYIWDESDTEKLHILCLPIDISLRSIRSLEANHIPLLNHMKKVSCDAIKQKYDINDNELKMFFHYEPSTYHLHIHFVNMVHKDSGSSVEYSHELDSVLFNLNLDSDYYKKILLNKRC
jgi:m7GpppX diphosphatase